MNYWFLLAAIPIFAVIVLVHEFGHFITAKWAGIRVEEFGIGFPPRAIGIKRGETIYSINWLPLGGFVRMPGENGETTDAQGAPDPGSFSAKPAWKRLIVLLAGVTMNFLLAVALFTTAHAVGRPDFQPVVGKVVAGSPAQQAGLQNGDLILSVNGQQVHTWTEFKTDVSLAAENAPAGASTVPIVLGLRHTAQQPTTLTVNALVHTDPQHGHVGVEVDSHHVIYIREPLWHAPIGGIQEVGNVLGATGDAIRQVVRGTLPASQAVSGPVGIVVASGETASAIPQYGWYPLLFLTGALSLSLAVVNVLPIPALDGGRVLLILIEIARRGKRLSPQREGLINLVGMALLLMLIALVTVSDIGNLFSGH